MPSARFDLIAALCTEAGMIMEDASLLAVTLPGCPGERIGAVLDELAAQVAAMAALIAAARTLAARG